MGCAPWLPAGSSWKGNVLSLVQLMLGVQLHLAYDFVYVTAKAGKIMQLLFRWFGRRSVVSGSITRAGAQHILSITKITSDGVNLMSWCTYGFLDMLIRCRSPPASIHGWHDLAVQQSTD